MSPWAIIDIGSTSVGGALVHSSKGKIQQGRHCPELIYTTRHRAAFQKELDVERFLLGIERQLALTLGDLQARAGGGVSRMVIFLSSPFYAARIKTVKVVSPKPVNIGLSYLKKTLLDDSRTMELGSHRLIESRAMNLKLNGYALDFHDVGRFHHRATEVEMGHYLSFASRGILGRFERVVGSTFRQPEPEWHSFLFAFFGFLVGTLGRERRFLLFDVGGEITEVAVAWNGVLEESFSYPFGVNTILRRMATIWGTSPEEARSSLELYLGGMVHGAAVGKTVGLLNEVREDWLRGFRSAVAEVSRHVFLPENIFLIGDPQILLLFQNWLQDESLAELTLGHRQFSPRIIDRSVMEHFCVHGKETERDWSLMVESIFCDKILETFEI